MPRGARCLNTLGELAGGRPTSYLLEHFPSDHQPMHEQEGGPDPRSG